MEREKQTIEYDIVYSSVRVLVLLFYLFVLLILLLLILFVFLVFVFSLTSMVPLSVPVLLAGFV